jgi:hypothetical protein
MPEYPVRSLRRCEAMKILPCSWSMTLEKRFPRALRRSCSVEGSSSTTFFGRGESSGGFEEVLEGGDLESSAYRRI